MRFGDKVDTSFLQGLKMSSEVHNVRNIYVFIIIHNEVTAFFVCLVETW